MFYRKLKFPFIEFFQSVRFLAILILLPSLGYAQDIDLAKYEKSFYSQNGEDGVIEKILSIIETPTKYYVEFGAYDGYLCSNTRYLRESLGWKGLLLDGGFEDSSINLKREYITAENINELFEKYQVPSNFDFLSIDIDYNDFYVWLALNEKYKPKLVVIEYNAAHLPNEDRVVKYSPYYSGDGTNYFGGSILAMYQLARKKGYSLIYADQNGVNLFFLRNDIIEEQKLEFKNVNEVEKIYVPPKYGTGPNGGHPEDMLKREYVCSGSVIE